MGYTHGTQWDESLVKEHIQKVMDTLAIKRMPTSTEVRMLNVCGLDGAILRCGGYVEMANKMGLPRKRPTAKHSAQTIKRDIYKTINSLGLERMPSRSEIMRMPFGGSLHNAIIRSGGYEHWSNKLSLEIKDSETSVGRKYEKIAQKHLSELGYDVKPMTVKHPYDLLVNNAIKTDIKAGKAHTYNGYRWHTFGINKAYATCDLYVIYAIDEKDEIEKTLVIPGFELTLTSLNIGTNSVYDKYIDRWDYFAAYDGFYNQFK